MIVKVNLNSAGVADVTIERWRKNIRSCNRIHVPLEGKAIYHDIKKDCSLEPGSAYLLVNSSAANLELFPDYRYVHMYIDFRATPPLLNREVLKVDLSTDPVLSHLLEVVQELIRENRNTYHHASIIEGRDKELYDQTQQILKAIAMHLQRVYDLKVVENVAVESAVRYINEHYTEQIRNREIADCAHVNARYLIRLFVQNVGKSPYQYLTQCRIERSIEELRAGKSITETAFICGYQSENAFRIAFKKVMGDSPRAFLRQKNT